MVLRGSIEETAKKMAQCMKGGAAQLTDSNGALEQRFDPKTLEITPFDVIDTGRLCAIDGGSASIIGGAGFLAGCLRHGRVVYNDSKCTSREVSDTEVRMFTYNDDPTYVEYLNKRQDDPLLRYFGLGPLLDKARVKAEFDQAMQAIDSMQKGDLLIMDGTLRPHLPGTSPMVEELRDKATDAGIILIGISKKSDLAIGLRPLTIAVNDIAIKAEQKGPWFCRIQERSGLFVVKYHQGAQQVFRTDVLGDITDEDAKRAFGIIARYSNDPAFMGYPYPLVDVHRRVAIKPEERIEIATMLKRDGMKYGLDIEKIESGLADLHMALNRGV